MSLGSISSRQGLVSLTPCLHAWAIFLNSSFIAHPCFHLLYDAFLHWSSTMSSLMTQSSLLIRLLVFMSAGLFLYLDHADLEGLLAYLSSFALQRCLPRGLTYQFPKCAEICSSKVQGLPSATLLPLSSQDLTLHHFMVTTARAVADSHIPNLFSIVSE